MLKYNAVLRDTIDQQFAFFGNIGSEAEINPLFFMDQKAIQLQLAKYEICLHNCISMAMLEYFQQLLYQVEMHSLPFPFLKGLHLLCVSTVSSKLVTRSIQFEPFERRYITNQILYCYKYFKYRQSNICYFHSGFGPDSESLPNYEPLIGTIS